MSIQNRLCDASMMSTLTNQVNKIQNDIVKLQNSAASSIKHEHYYEMDSAIAHQSFHAEDLMKTNDLRKKHCEWSENLLALQENAIKQFEDIAVSAKRLSVIAMNQIGTNAVGNMYEDCTSHLAMIEDLLNQSYFGMNIWNGSRIDETPFRDLGLVNGTPKMNLEDVLSIFNLTFDDKSTFTKSITSSYNDANLISRADDLYDALNNLKTSLGKDSLNESDLNTAAENAAKAFFNTMAKLGNNQSDYLGDDFDLKVYVGNTSVEYGDRANYDAFKNLLKAIQIMRDSQDSTRNIDKNAIVRASELIDRSQNSFTELIQKVGNAQQSVQQIKDNIVSFQETLTDMFNNTLNGMNELDSAMKVIEVAAIQRKLSYILPMTMNYLKEMSVVKYL